MTFNIHHVSFTVFLGALSAVPPLAIDMALPSVSLVRADLQASEAAAAAAIAVFLAGFATAPVVVGPLSDRFGRKPVMLGGLALFALCAAAARLRPRSARCSFFAFSRAWAQALLASCRAPSCGTCSRAGRRACRWLPYRSSSALRR